MNSLKMQQLIVKNSASEFVSKSLTSQRERFGWDAGIYLRFEHSETSGLSLLVGFQHTSEKREIQGYGYESTSENYIPKIDLIHSGLRLI